MNIEILALFYLVYKSRGIEPLSTSDHSTHILWLSSGIFQLKTGVEIRGWYKYVIDDKEREYDKC